MALASWSFDNIGDIYYFKINVPGITQDVRDNGIVNVYLKTEEGWVPLPYSGLIYPNDFTTYEIVTGAVNISYYDNVNATQNPGNSGMIVKIVIVPKAGKAQKPNTDTSIRDSNHKLEL